jgi:hypothetical protein
MRGLRIYTGCPGREKKLERWVATAVVLAVTTLLKGGWVGYELVGNGMLFACREPYNWRSTPPPWLLLSERKCPVTFFIRRNEDLLGPAS